MQRQSVVSSRWTVVEALTYLLGCYCICVDLSSVLVKPPPSLPALTPAIMPLLSGDPLVCAIYRFLSIPLDRS